MGVLVDVQATVRVGGILSAFQRLRRIDLTNVYKRLRKPMHKDQREHRDAQAGPRGRWAPLAASTKARYAREGKRRNRRILARLPNARRTKVSSSELRMYSPVKRYSLAHQKGAIVGRGSVLPQRQFFYISKKLRKEAKRQFKIALLQRWNET